VVARVTPRGRVTARVRVGRNPLGSAVVGGTLWVACIDGNEIAAIDLETARVRRRIVEPGGPIAICRRAPEWPAHAPGRPTSRRQP